LIVQETMLEPGEEIRVAHGAFQGLTAVVQQVLPAAQRVRVLLEILGRSAAVEIGMADIVQADQMAWKRSVAGPN
jgi:transcription antitermination factor NusG